MFTEFNNILKEYKKQAIVLTDQWLEDKKAEFIYSSNKLEGNRLKLTETYSIIKDKMNFSSEARFKDVLEVKGHVKALDTCLFMVKNKYPLTANTLKTLNSSLLSALWKFDEYYPTWKQNNQELGTYKLINNSIKYTLDGQEGIIEPLSNVETVEKNMNTVLIDNKSINHLLEKAAHLAFQIWINQPFPDANKRTARLAVVYELMEQGLPLISFKAEGNHFNDGLLRCYSEKSLKPLISVIETEIKQQLSEIIELDKRLKINKKPPEFRQGGALIF